jgi:hypothetical protein
MTTSRTSPAPTTAIPGGRAVVEAEITTPGGADHGEIVLQALRRSDGSPMVRIAYRRDGRAVRGPVTMPPAVWRRLRQRAGRDPVLGPLIDA